MFDGLKILSILVAAKELIKEATEKPTPKGAWFDNEAYLEDERAGVPMKVMNKRLADGYYFTTKEKTRFDLGKYYYDALSGMSADELESRRMAGVYGADRPRYYGVNDTNYDTNGLPLNVIVDVRRYEWDMRKKPGYHITKDSSSSRYDWIKDKSQYERLHRYVY